MHVDGIGATLAGLDAAPPTMDSLSAVKGWWTAASLGADITDPASIAHARTGLALARAFDDANLIGRMGLQLGACINHSTTDPGYHEHLVDGRRLFEAHS